MEKKEKVMLLTGGHAGATAYAVIQEIKKEHKDWIIYWIGAKSAIEGKKVEPLEHKVLPKLGVHYLPLIAGRLQVKFTIWTIPSVLKTPIGFFHALFYLLRHRPKVVLSFGGYVAFPVVVSAWILRIPVILHEQTIKAGLANRMSIPFADVILLARKDSLEFFPRKKSKVVGNPVSEGIRSVRVKHKLQKRPVIFITGGSRGSLSINNVVAKTLKRLLNGFDVVHQTGESHFGKFKKLKKELSENDKEKYEIFPIIDNRKWHKFIENADIVISRAGANIVSEIIYTRRPSILIPIPFTHANEQVENAKMAVNIGIARMLEERKLDEDNLMREIKYVKGNWKEMIEKSGKNINLDKDASTRVLKVLEGRLNE